MDSSDPDSDLDISEIIESEDISEDNLLLKLVKFIPTLSPNNITEFTPKDLRGGSSSDHSLKQIPDHIYSLHIAYLHWRKYRHLNDPIPLLIREAVAHIKPQVWDDRKMIRSFVQKRLTEYTLKETGDGLMLIKGGEIVLSAGMMQTVVEWYHERLNHPSITTLYKSLKTQFYTWGLEQDKLKKLYLDLQCDICSSNVSLPKRPHSNHIKTFEIFERIQIDLTQVAFGDYGEGLSKRGYRWVLTVIDCFSKYAWGFPLKTKESDNVCFLLLELFSNEGVPKILQSDNGGEFVSTIIRNLMPKLGIKLINGSPYTPTSQGQVERFNRTIKSLLRKEIQIEISKNNPTVVEDWASNLLPRIIDTYRHTIHRSLSRTPWELYNNRTSPHPLKTNTQSLQSISRAEIEECCQFPNTQLASCPSSIDLGLKDAIRAYSNVRGKLNIITLTQTRKVQMENFRRFKRNIDVNLELGTIAYMKNPTVSRHRKKKNFLEPMNIKVKILKQHFASDQYQIEYLNSKGILKSTWIHKTELFTGNTTNLESMATNAREMDTIQFNIQDYNKLVTNFEQHIAEKWCNSRKMKHKLLREIENDDNDHFCELDSKQIREGKSNSFQYYGEFIFEVLDLLFIQFCANSLSAQYDQDSSHINCVLRYLAHKNFTEHLGYLQHWFRDRRNDARGENFYKIHELQNHSIKHHCESCIYTDHCEHECCLKLLSFTYHQKISSSIYDEEPTFKHNVNCKRSRIEFPEDALVREDDDGLFSAKHGQEYQSDNDQFSLDEDRSKNENLLLKPTQMSQKINKKLKTDCNSRNLSFTEDLFKPITFKWRQRINQGMLLLKSELEDPPELVKTAYIKLINCSPKKKVSIIPDGNCLYRAFSWWLTDTQDFHGLIRTKLVQFMESSPQCKKYVNVKANQSMEEYLTQNNTMMSTVWGSDVEIFSMAIWIQTDVFVYINNKWDKFSFKGFNPKVGRNAPSNQAIYLGNEASHYEPIISVVRREKS